MGNNIIFKPMNGKRKSCSLAMYGIIWHHFYYVKYLHFQLSAPIRHYIPFMQHTVCGNDPMMNILRAAYTFICQLPENIETRLKELRSPLYLSNAALLWQCSWLDCLNWLSVKGSTLTVSPQDNILVASYNWLMVSKLD